MSRKIWLKAHKPRVRKSLSPDPSIAKSNYDDQQKDQQALGTA
jgi:hypothetical protein